MHLPTTGYGTAAVPVGAHAAAPSPAICRRLRADGGVGGACAWLRALMNAARFADAFLRCGPRTDLPPGTPTAKDF